MFWFRVLLFINAKFLFTEKKFNKMWNEILGVEDFGGEIQAFRAFW